MMTVDNSTLFTEGNFQPNDLINQMAELEVLIYASNIMKYRLLYII